MSEKERFKVYKVSGNFGEWEVEDIVDDEVVIDHITHKYLADKLCDKLNQLSDENEQLKQAYAKLKHRHSLLHDVCIDAECDRDRYRKDITSLEKENEQLKTDNGAFIQDIEVFKEENTHLKLENMVLKDGVVHYNLLKEDIETVLNYIGTNIVLNFARNDDTYSLNDRERLAYIRLSKSIGKGYDDVDLDKW